MYPIWLQRLKKPRNVLYHLNSIQQNLQSTRATRTDGHLSILHTDICLWLHGSFAHKADWQPANTKLYFNDIYTTIPRISRMCFPPQHTLQKPSPSEQFTHLVKRIKLHWHLNPCSALPSTVTCNCYPGTTWRLGPFATKHIWFPSICEGYLAIGTGRLQHSLWLHNGLNRTG